MKNTKGHSLTQVLAAMTILMLTIPLWQHLQMGIGNTRANIDELEGIYLLQKNMELLRGEYKSRDYLLDSTTMNDYVEGKYEEHLWTGQWTLLDSKAEVALYKYKVTINMKQPDGSFRTLTATGKFRGEYFNE